MSKKPEKPTWTKLPPHTDPYIGCLTCGAGEMRGTKEKIIASLRTKIYQGYGGWHITRDGKTVYSGDPDVEWKSYPSLMTFENMARKNPDHDWRAECFLALREATYQRQGKNEWVLVSSGDGFA